MFDFLFPKDWSTLKKLIWLKASVLIGAVYSTFTGSIARFLSPSSKPVKSIVCNIEPVQSGSGDPSPDNVRPISGFTGLNVYGTGKNMFNIGTVSNWKNNSWMPTNQITISDNTVSTIIRPVTRFQRKNDSFSRWYR